MEKACVILERKWWKYFVFGLAFAWAGFFVAVGQMPSSEAAIWFLNVGQGDATLIRSPEGHNVLIDGGPGTVVMEELSEVLPFFARQIDLMVLTHPHADHIEGLVEVLKRYKVGSLLLTGVSYNNVYYEEFLKNVRDLSEAGELDLYFAEASTDFVVGSLYLDVLYPLENLAGRKFSNINNSSIVVRVEGVGGGEFGGRSFMLTGDCEVECEEEVLAAGEDVDSDILKAGHHGSKTASSHEFVEAVSPSVGVISCGETNKFGHPHSESLRTFYRLGVDEIFRTDLDGRIEF